MKTLKQILEVYSPKSADEKRFVKKHITIKHADRNGNGDDVFTGSNVKEIDRKTTRKGYNTADSEAVYEEYDVELVDEARSSSSFQFTHKPGDAESEKKLADLKAQHKGSSNRVVLKGRLGKNNPNAQKYKDAAKANKGKGYGAHAYQTIKKADAAHHDVYVYRKATEEIEQVDELKKSTLASYASKASKSAAGLATTAMHHKNASKQWDDVASQSADKKYANKKSKEFNKYSTDATNKQIKRQKGVDSALKRLAKEEVEVNEVLKVSQGAGEWIKDFQTSDNPKFAGKSKEQRKQQALAAFYAAKRAGKE